MKAVPSLRLGTSAFTAAGWAGSFYPANLKPAEYLGYYAQHKVRNKNWLGAELYNVLRQRGVALALIDHPWTLRPTEILAKGDPITADFTYIRWLGDRKGIEEETKSWDKTIVNRRRELEGWVEVCRNFNQRSISILAFANNHYAGHAPATVRLFRELWGEK